MVVAGVSGGGGLGWVMREKEKICIWGFLEVGVVDDGGRDMLSMISYRWVGAGEWCWRDGSAMVNCGRQ